MLFSLRQCAEPLTQLHRLWVKAHLEFLVCSISQEPLKKFYYYKTLIKCLSGYIEPSPLSRHYFYNKMLHISDCLLAAGEFSCHSDRTLVGSETKISYHYDNRKKNVG